MIPAPIPTTEDRRIEALQSYELLDSLGIEAIDGLVRVASHICDAPIALVSLVDVDRQWFLSNVGLGAGETNRDVAFCSHAILDAQVMQVNDALDDPRFFDNPLVTENPNIRFYAGTPLIDAEGHALGTLCVIDRRPRALTPEQMDALISLGKGVTQLMALHRANLRQINMTERLIQQDRLATTGTLAAGIGHEINNPLAFVMTNVDLALEEMGEMSSPSTSAGMGNVQQLLSEAQGGIRRIGRIVRGLRSFAQGESADGPSLVRPSIDVSIQMTRHEVERVATLIVDVADGPVVALGESGLTQVVVNLLVNAAQAFPTADPCTNRITIRSFDGADNTVVIEVEDNGPGIEPSVRRQIFDPFFTTKPAGEGTGLGLAICHRVVDAAGGELTCDSAPGQGTTFRIRLPMSANPLVEGQAEPAVIRSVAALRVLVVDDEPAIVRAVQRALSRTHHVQGTSDPTAALGQLVDAKPCFDAVICDVMMPTLTGPDLYRAASQARPELADRFIFVSGGLASPAVEEFLAVQGRQWIEKPFSADELRQVVARVNQRQPGP